MDTSVNINFNNIPISNIDSIKFSLYNGSTLLGTRTSSGDNLVNLLKDSAQYWEKSVDTYTGVKGIRTVSTAFMKRLVDDDNRYWKSSAINIYHTSIPDVLLVEVVVDNVTYYSKK